MISLPFSLPARSRFVEDRGKAGDEGDMRLHPHLNPPPSRGRRIVANSHGLRVSSRHGGLWHR